MTKTKDLLDEARDLLVQAQESEVGRSHMVYAAQNAVQEVLEVIARSMNDSRTLALREAYAYSVDSVIREADRGSLLGFDPAILRGAIAILS